MSDRTEWNAWGDTPDPIPAPKDGTLSLLWMKLRRLAPTRPTAIDDTEGQLRYEREGDVTGALYLGRYTAGAVYEWEQLNAKQPLDPDLTALAGNSTNGLWARTGDGTGSARTLTAGSSKISVSNGDGVSGNPTVDLGTVTLGNLSGVTTISPANAGKTFTYDGTNWDDMWSYCETLGPWYLNDVPGTATTAMGIAYFNTATAVSRSTNRIRAGRTGWIVGAKITSDAARTAGTATVQVDLSGVGTAFDGGSVVLDGTRTTQDATIVAASSGIQITSGSDTIGVNIVTSGWTPTTADVFVTLLVIWDPIA